MSLSLNRAPLFLTLACLSLACAAAHAGDPVTISITNNDTDDILVTVYDMNTRPHAKVLDGQVFAHSQCTSAHPGAKSNQHQADGS